MIPTIKEIEEKLFEWAPKKLAEDWDNVGLQVGDPDAQVKRSVISLDISNSVFSFALKEQADLVISHHPLIFNPIRSLNLKEYKARLLAGFLRHDIGVISMHTNLDSALGGVNDRLCELLEIENAVPLLPNKEDGSQGLGRIGNLKTPLKKEEFLTFISKKLGKNSLAYCGTPKGTIKKVAICSGSGSTLFEEAIRHQIDAYITGEVKHSTALMAKDIGILLVDAGHFHTEHPVVEKIYDYLLKTKEENDWDIQLIIFGEEESPKKIWKND